MSAKVTWGAAGAAGGSVIGSSLADLLTSVLTSGMGIHLTEKNVASIEILTVGALAWCGSFLVGYFKGSGLSIKQQTAELKEAKHKSRQR